jgi:pimeloyl-ACP methyl ester carboxylesterase
MMNESGGYSRREFLGGALVVGAATALPTIPVARRQTTSSFVLVHGAWHGAWCWRRVADRLTAKGHYVSAPTLTGVGERTHLASDAVTLSTHVDDVVNEIKWKDLDRLVLVGHSYAGMVITGVAERLRERIAAIIYFDALIPRDGQSVIALRGPTGEPYPTPMVPAPAAASFKVNEKDLAWVSSKLTPQPTRCFTEPLRVTDAYQTIAKKVYVRAPAYAHPAIDAAYQRVRGDRSWTTFEFSCGHEVMIDQPAEIAALLESLV